MKVGRCIRCPMMDVALFDTKEHETHFGDNTFCGQAKQQLAKGFGILSKDGKKRTIFHSAKAEYATVDELKVFTKYCVPNCFEKTKNGHRQKPSCLCGNNPPPNAGQCPYDDNNANNAFKPNPNPKLKGI